MPNFTGKSGGGPHAMKMYGQGKNPIKMDHAMKMKDLSGDNKITQKDVLIGRGVIDPPAKMDHAMKKYGAHKMSYPMKGKGKGKMKNMSREQQKAVFASGYKG